MNRNNYIQWIHNEIPSLVDAGVLSGEAAARLREHYGEPDIRSRRNLAFTICSILGSVLVGAGVILLLAYNWDGMSRPVRLLLSLAPLVLTQGIGLWGLWTGRTSAAWREGTAALQMFAVGASIALVGQTYHISGDLGSFFLTWMLLSLPLVYVLDVSLPAVLFLAGITSWAGYEQSTAGQAVLFWPLVGLVGPHFWRHARQDANSVRSSLLAWGLVICISVGAGVVLEKMLPGTWIIVYSALFAAFFLAGSYWFSDITAPSRRPLYTVGALAIPVLSFLLTFEWTWDDIGWNHYRYGGRFHEWAAAADYVTAAVLLLAWVLLIVQTVRRGEKSRIVFGALPALAVAGYAVTGFTGDEMPAMLLFNAYTVLLGLDAIFNGLRKLQVGTVNFGMLILAMIITARFFDTDMSYLARGLVFIVIGLGFLGANVFMARRVKGGAQ